MSEDKSNIDITVDAAPDFQSVTLSFVTDNSAKEDISVGFSLAEAQQLHLYLGEAITMMLLHELQLDTTPATKH